MRKQQFETLAKEDVLVEKPSVLVLGVGNYLMGDEGVGVHVAKQMEEMELPNYVEVVDGGTGGFFLMNYFDEFEKVIFIDATMDGKPAGTVNLIKPRFAADFPKALSVHDVGLKDMVESLYVLGNVPELHLFTISIEEVKPMYIGMSEPVNKVCGQLVESILSLAEELHLQS